MEQKLSHFNDENALNEIVNRVSSFNRILDLLINNPELCKKFNFKTATHNLDEIQSLSQRLLKNNELETVTQKLNGYRTKLEKLAGYSLSSEITANY